MWGKRESHGTCKLDARLPARASLAKLQVWLMREYLVLRWRTLSGRDFPVCVHVCMLTCFSHVSFNLMDYNLPGSSVHRILQAWILEWVAMLSSRESSWPRDQTCISYVLCIGRWVLTTSTIWEVYIHNTHTHTHTHVCICMYMYHL